MEILSANALREKRRWDHWFWSNLFAVVFLGICFLAAMLEGSQKYLLWLAAFLLVFLHNKTNKVLSSEEYTCFDAQMNEDQLIIIRPGYHLLEIRKDDISSIEYKVRFIWLRQLIVTEKSKFQYKLWIPLGANVLVNNVNNCSKAFV